MPGNWSVTARLAPSVRGVTALKLVEAGEWMARVLEREGEGGWWGNEVGGGGGVGSAW